MSSKNKKPSQARGFFKGVFWTTYIGMATFIAWPHIQPIEPNTTPIQSAEMANAFQEAENDQVAQAALDLGDLK